jgi:hypothetical protein
MPASAIRAVAAVGRAGGTSWPVWGPVLPLGVVIPLTFQALPIRAGLHGGSRDDDLEPKISRSGS